MAPESVSTLPPSPWIVRHAPLLKPGARVLDVACGGGRHVRWLQQQGHKLYAVDRNAEALARAGTPAPADLLMSISGDLGNAGQLAELLALVEPRFEASVHGLMVGNNLITAHLDLGQASQAGVILRRLIAQNRPDWREHLAFWDKEITAARSRAR